MQNFKNLSLAEMKNVFGGRTDFTCYAVTPSGGNGTPVTITADNINQAQGTADAVAYSDQFSSMYPNGINCPGSD